MGSNSFVPSSIESMIAVEYIFIGLGPRSVGARMFLKVKLTKFSIINYSIDRTFLQGKDIDRETTKKD